MSVVRRYDENIALADLIRLVLYVVHTLAGKDYIHFVECVRVIAYICEYSM